MKVKLLLSGMLSSNTVIILITLIVQIKCSSSTETIPMTGDSTNLDTYKSTLIPSEDLRYSRLIFEITKPHFQNQSKNDVKNLSIQYIKFNKIINNNIL